MIKDILQNYVGAISLKFSHEETSEMGYRTDFEILLKGIFESINVSRFDHDARANQGNKPDFVVIKNDVPILYIETKDIGVSLDKIEKSEQMSRYFGYANLVLTDYVEFRFYRNGLPYGEPIKIAEYNRANRIITPFPNSFEYLAKTLLDFAQSHKEPIRSGKHLSKIMGGKAQRIRDNVRQFLSTESDKNVELVRVYETIKKLLVHDLTQDAFADMYAQTLVYGLFAARYHDESQESFSRQEARDLIPNSNPFLRHFFDHIVGPNFDKRLEYIVNELCEVFSHANIQELMREYFKVDLWGQTHSDPDPVIHFYEDFLKEYDPELRKKMGAYYTPLPVVQFIVRSIDYLLKKEFDLTEGLADTSKTSDGLHRVQILDPAVGTGTFISKIIRNIYEHLCQTGQEGRWHPYVLHDLLPRLYGFELMMTPYTIAHLKLSMAFKETGFKYFNNRRLGIYLTNSLEEGIVQGDLFTAFGLAESIAEESKEASKIKNDRPIMVVIGNPPYSVSSSNKGEWIQNLTKDYKKNLNERNIQPLSDDYIKFIRFAEHFIEKNNSGIVAMITNNSFLDGIIHRQMRKHLLETFDDIYILNLHGSSKKKETTPDGGKDENVFDIQQGVSINIFVRKEGEKKGLGKVYHSDLYGKRADKFETLNKSNLKNIKWQELKYSEPYYFFVPKDFRLEEEYVSGFKVDELFEIFNAGSATGKDSTFVKMNFSELVTALYYSNIKFSDENITDYLYRPFDMRKIIYDSKLIQRLRSKVMDHMQHDNIALLTCKNQTSFDFQHIFISRSVTDRCSVSLQTGEVGYIFPLYLYSDDGSKTPNLKQEIVDQIEKIVGETTPEDIFDYIYAVLHSPNYREKYKEFLKIDFPRVPYPKDEKIFKKLVVLGAELRSLHLLEPPKVNQFITTYPESGPDVIDKPVYKDGKVYINDKQYFGNVTEVAWNFWVGGYQPAQKWLKDRKGRILTNSDIEHYQKMIVALVETNKIMHRMDEIARNI
jgi:type I restriction-modification system DNA methylase subunit